MAAASVYLPPTGVEVVFLLLGVVALAAAVLVVTTRHLVHAALWLVVALGALAGCYLLPSAEFVAWVQVLIYVGAVVVLPLFGLMLTRAPIGASNDLDAPPAQPACPPRLPRCPPRLAYVELPGEVGTAKATGAALFRGWVLPFEVLSVLLLAALVGAIVLSRRDIGDIGGGDVTHWCTSPTPPCSRRCCSPSGSTACSPAATPSSCSPPSS